MTFYDRFEMLCFERKMKPQSQEMLEIAGVTSPAISGWKNKGSLPKGEVLCRLAKYFGVTTDYLLCLSELRSPETPLSEEETILIQAYRESTVQGRFHIIQACMNAQQEKGQAAIAG